MCKKNTIKRISIWARAVASPLGELLADMNGKLISYGQKADMPLQITELGKAILLGTVRDIFAGKTE